MSSRVLIVAGVAAVGVAGAWLLRRDGSPEAMLEDRWAMVEEYCIDCHNDAEFTGDVSFEGMHADDVLDNAELFELALHKLNIRAMPPRDAEQPEPEVRAQFVSQP